MEMNYEAKAAGQQLSSDIRAETDQSSRRLRADKLRPDKLPLNQMNPESSKNLKFYKDPNPRKTVINYAQ